VIRTITLALLFPCIGLAIAAIAAVLSELNAPSWVVTGYLVGMVILAGVVTWQLSRRRAHDPPALYADLVERFRKREVRR
jgi:hypothetical protein